MTKPMKPSFQAMFPNITRWVKDFGTVELGYDPNTDSFMRAMDEGGMVWKGESHYEYLDDAFLDLEKGIRATLSVQAPRHKPSAKSKVSSKPSKTTTTDRPQISPLPKQVQKLEEIVESIRRNESVQVTRLTVVKKLCENPEAAGAFAMFLARKAQGRLRDKQSKERYLQLASSAISEMKFYLDDPTEDRKQRLRSLLLEIEAEQNEYESVKWGVVRNIKSRDLVVVENSLRTILNRDEAPYWLYQASRDYAGGSIWFERGSIPQIEDIAGFWRQYFTAKA
jgi:hypothetical protein